MNEATRKMPRASSTYSASSPANRPARWSRQAAGLVLVAKVYPTPPVAAIRAHQVSSGRAIGARASANPRCEIRPARSRPASPWRPAGPNRDRSPALPDRRRARPRRSGLAPVDRREQRARLLALVEADLEHARPIAGRYARKAVVAHPNTCRVVRMDLDEWLGAMRGELRAHAGARHGVPVVAHAPGVETEREVRCGRGARRRRLGRNEVRLAVGREEAAVREQAIA